MKYIIKIKWIDKTIGYATDNPLCLGPYGTTTDIKEATHYSSHKLAERLQYLNESDLVIRIDKIAMVGDALIDALVLL